MTAPHPTTLSFRPLAEDDLPLLTEWFNRPHVYEWWGIDATSDGLGGPGDKATTVEAVSHMYGPGRDEEHRSSHQYVVLSDGTAIGYIHWYPIAAAPEYAHAIGETDAATIDYLIGEPDLVDRGIGSAMIAAFVEDVVAPSSGTKRVVASPSVENPRSVRALEKAGFVFARDAEVGDPTLERVMVRTLD